MLKEKTKVIIDNGGNIYLQLDGVYGCCTNDPETAACWYSDYLVGGIADWDFDNNDQDVLFFTPSSEEMASGGYEVFTANEIEEMLNCDTLVGFMALKQFIHALKQNFLTTA